MHRMSYGLDWCDLLGMRITSIAYIAAYSVSGPSTYIYGSHFSSSSSKTDSKVKPKKVLANEGKDRESSLLSECVLV